MNIYEESLQFHYVNEEMKVAAAYAISGAIDKCELNVDNIIPKALDLKVQRMVAETVKGAVIKSGATNNFC